MHPCSAQGQKTIDTALPLKGLQTFSDGKRLNLKLSFLHKVIYEVRMQPHKDMEFAPVIPGESGTQ